MLDGINQGSGPELVLRRSKMPFDISHQIENWRIQLLDTSKRNRLINFKTGRAGGIRFVHPDTQQLWNRLTTPSSPLLFAWKRDLIDLTEEWQESTDDTLGMPPASLPKTSGPTLNAESGTIPAGNVPLALPYFPDLIEFPTEPLGQAEESSDGPGVPPPDLTRSLSPGEILALCLDSPRLKPEHLLTELPDKRLAARLSRLALSARESLTEQGVTTLYVAFGFLRWFESPDSQEEILSPLLLVPVRLERQSVESPWQLHADDEEILPNHTLAQRLASDFKVRFPITEDETIDTDDLAWRTDYYAAVERCVQHHPGWEVRNEAAIGTFSFQKLAMWEDLGRNQDRIKAHELCRAIAGDRTFDMRRPADLPRAEDLDDKTQPADTHHILDADSSQHAAIVAATRGAHLVLDGPPGTGKSQTIANTIAEFLAAGKTVLFVSEKTAALDVVKRRLDERRLGDFCLELHSHKANKRRVINELGRCLNLAPEPLQDVRDDSARLYEARAQLNAHVRELHKVRQPLGFCAYRVHGEVAKLERLSSVSRCPIPDILSRDSTYLRKLTELLSHLPQCRTVIEEGDRHPWHNCRATVYSLTLRDDLRHHCNRLAESLGKFAEPVSVLTDIGVAPSNPSLDQLSRALASARAALVCPDMPAAWFETDPRQVAEAVIQLNRISQRIQQLMGSLTEFAPEALQAVNAAA
jgi:hypothetical protein